MGLAEQYKIVLNNKFGRDVAVFDYATDFLHFWDEKDDGDDQVAASPTIIEFASKSAQKALIIVWDGMPNDKSDNGKLPPHLTPLDWALAFALRMLGLEKAGCADFSIHIIDLTVKAYEDAFVSHMRDTLLAEMPWVKLYAPLVPKDKKGKEVRYRRGYKNITDLINLNIQPPSLVLTADVLTMADSLKGQEEPVKQALSLVANAWRASLIQSDDHHDLNNLIGATVASGGDDDSPLIRAFCKRLEFSGHLSQSYLEERNKAVDGVIDVVNADILVIDDMLSMGWDRYLCKALGAKHEAGTSFGLDKFVQFGIQGSLKLHGCLSAAALIESWKIKQPRLDQRNFSHRFLPNSDKTSHGEILFLDLRLGDTQKIKDQVSALLDIFGSSLSNAELLAWTAIDKVEQENIRKWCKEPNVSENTDGFVDAITLLPRICALINPLVSVILFSSTTRADIKHKLSSYRNVYCGFEKPQVLQQPESIRQSILGLQHQLRDCKKLIAFRRSLAFVEKQAEEARKSRTPIAPGFESVECFIDESEKKVGMPGNNNFKLLSGSFVLIAEGDNIAQAVNECLQATNLGTTKYAPGLVNPDAHVLLRNETRENVVSNLEPFAGTSKKICVGFQIDDLQMTQVSMDLFGDNHPERKLDYLLRFLIDFQGVVLPWYLGYSSNAAKFCFDERSLPASGQAEMDDRDARYALKAIPGVVNKNKTYSAGSYFPIIREAMLRWPNSWWKLNPHTARGYSLSNNLPVSHCHYLADWVAGALREGKWDFLDGIVDNGHIYSVDATGSKFWLLESFRFAAHGACEEAIVYLLLHGGITGPAQCLDEPRNAKVEQILLLGIYDHALQHARGDALFQALSADKNSRKYGVQSIGIPERSSSTNDEELENSISQPDEIFDKAVDNQQSLTAPVPVGESSDENKNVAEKHSFTVIEVLQSATPVGWTVEDSSKNRFFLPRTSRSEEHNTGDVFNAKILGESRNVAYRGKSEDFQLIVLEA